jgi:hypothetical protein
VTDVVIPRTWREGDRQGAAKLNRLVSGVVRARPATPVPASRVELGRLSGLMQVRLVEHQADVVIVEPWDGAEAGESFAAAKPYLLRTSPFDGGSWNGVSYSYASVSARTATLGGDSEDQVIVPAYVPGDLLYVARLGAGGSSVTDDAGAPVDWIDLNLDARAWAKAAA